MSNSYKEGTWCTGGLLAERVQTNPFLISVTTAAGKMIFDRSPDDITIERWARDCSGYELIDITHFSEPIEAGVMFGEIAARMAIDNPHGYQDLQWSGDVLYPEHINCIPKTENMLYEYYDMTRGSYVGCRLEDLRDRKYIIRYAKFQN